ncbi:MAG TPA: beta-L-arabinofuranosidase domain-containing protein, partial [Thermomicrobiales bacterium]|nr:beta-L-arabinofuranosidase domain-containing protein [Thermomicrobiales bacterium]
QWEQIEATGRLANFRRAAGELDDPYQGRYFNDSDLYKWIEAASWTLAAHPDPDLSAKVESAVAAVAAAQRPDGYLNTYFARDRAEERWTDLDLHELYCAGHLFEAAVAHRRATGSDELLAVARRFADHVVAEFGPAKQAERPWADGHPEVELALVELYRETGERAYLEQAETFIDVRGHERLGRPYGRWGPEYHQDHLPLREMRSLAGHAVRAMYYVTGAANVALETGEPALIETLEHLWRDTGATRTYVSGGLGARHDGESFGEAHELPNATAYAETCAAIGAVFWNARMLALTAEARYADGLEHALYNAVLPGVGLDGESYFYTNPLADRGEHRRQPWFATACCPPNVARLLASLPAYAASVSEGAVWLHLFLAGAARLPLPDGRTVALRIATRYPWDGDIDISVDTPGEFAVHLRVPGWAKGATLEVGNHAADIDTEPGSYVSVRREWAAGDTLHLSLPMAPFAVASHPAVLENAGRVALRRGPLLYCAEATDHPRADPRDLVLPAEAPLTPSWRPELLGGVTVLTADALAPDPDPGWDGRLYRPTGEIDPPRTLAHAALTAIPYFAWANRAPGPMQVWLRHGQA